MTNIKSKICRINEVMFGFMNSWRDKISIEILVLLHLAITSFGVIGIFFTARFVFENRYAADVALHKIDSARYFDWLSPYFFPAHKFTIYAYIGVCTLLGLLALATLLMFRKGISKERINYRLFPWVYLLDLIVIQYMISTSIANSSSTSPDRVTIALVLWLLIVALPFLSKPKKLGIPKLIKVAFSPGALILVIAIEFIVVLLPFMTGNALVYNEYFDIPSKTWISTSAQENPEQVDNLNYINRNKLWGNHLLYDPRINPGEDPECLPGAKLDLPKTEALGEFVEKRKDQFYFRYPSGELCFVGLLQEKDAGILGRLFPAKVRDIENVYLQSQEIFSTWSHEELPHESYDFLRNNQTEISQAIHGLENIFHHHFQFINPIKELDEGRPTNEIVALYGLNFIPAASIVQRFGGVTYTACLSVIFIIYIVYLTSVLGITAYIFRDLRYAAIIFLSYIGLVEALGHITLFIGIGYSPIRHILDIFVVLSLFQYLVGKKNIWLMGAITLALLSVFLDKSLGSFVFLSLLTTLIIRLICGHTHSKRAEILAIAMSFPAYVALFVASGKIVASNPYDQGFLDGMWGFPVNNTQIEWVLASLILIYALLTFVMARHFNHRHYVTLFLLMYAQLYALYWLTIPNYGHLYAFLPVLILAGLSLLRFGIAPLVPIGIERKVVATALMLALAVSLWGLDNYWKGYKKIQEVETSHKIFAWDFSNMKIRSTMDPVPFANSAELIRKYAPDRGGVYIFSKYDTLLTFLADRYSLMNHFELSTFLNNEASENQVIKLIQTNKPSIIFVDTCIKCNPQLLRLTRPLPFIDPVYNERSKEGVAKLLHLRDTFEKIESDYELVERGILISVLRRKETKKNLAMQHLLSNNNS